MQTDTPSAIGSIDQHLGPAHGRFFGEGFKRVNHSLTNLVIQLTGDHGYISGTCGLTYPRDWTHKSSGRVRPHVSSIDGVVLAVELADAYLTHRYGLDLGERRRMWLRSFEMRATSPQEEVGRFAVLASHTGSLAVSGSLCAHVSTFQCRIGTMGLTCMIEHDIRSQTASDGSYSSSTEILGDSTDRYYGEGYQHRTQEITGVMPAADGQSVRATITVADELSRSDCGLAGHYQPAVSMIDCLLVLAQLAQVLAYRIDGIDREKSSTLWMRRLAMSSPTPLLPLDATVGAVVAVRRGRLLEVGQGFWRLLDLTGQFGVVKALGSIAHVLPYASTLLGAD
jgi:hypothetical protein